MHRLLLVAIVLIAVNSQLRAQEEVPPSAQYAQRFGLQRGAVQVQPDGLYICEAEEFQVETPSPTGWRPRRFGENYYAATFANSFLSRKAFLGAPAQADTTATIRVNIKEAGRYLVLVRYEAAYRFETQFQVQVEQAGRIVLDRRYGARDNVKIWAFSQKLKTEVGWSWGAVENIVWEGHDAFANLKPGPATIRLIAGKQPEPAAKRNIDLVMLTTDVDEVMTRIDKEKYLPLDGMLTQSGDVYVRVTNKSSKPLTFTGKKAIGGGNWQQHSPYWVHIRNWKPPKIDVPPGQTSAWIEVGGTMDSLADGQWFWTGNGAYRAEFGVRAADGRIETLETFDGAGDLALAADADTRYRRRLRRQEEVLYDLLGYLKQENPAPHGRAPQQTIIYASTFTPLDSGKHAAAVKQFKQLFSLADTRPDTSGGRGYIDVRSVPTPKLAEYCQKLGDNAKNVAVVSLGDEIRLPTPRGAEVNQQFRDWLQSRGVTPKDVFPDGEGDANDLIYRVDEPTKKQQPGLYYWSKRYQYHHGIQSIKQRTDILRRHLPNAAIGANYSPHYPQEHMFLGEVFKWVSVFRQSGMTLPWSEDYIWQVPVGTPQMNNINLDLYRAANRHHPDRKVMYYVMPHMPNNTPNQWRRLFYGALGHGMKQINLFEFRPVHVAYTENHVDRPEMYRMILRSFRELGLFEDIVQSGRVRNGQAALWFSETADIWGDSHGSFAAGKRALYIAIRQQQIPLDFVVEEDALNGDLSEYKTLYLTDAHVSTAASQRIADWVKAGGRLFATANAGMYDELNRPNKILRELLGVTPTDLEQPENSKIIWIKQDVPFAAVLDQVVISDQRRKERSPATPRSGDGSFPVVGVRSRFKTTSEGATEYVYADKTPAVFSRKVGKGETTYCGMLPGLSYFQPAIPKRPVDRGSTDDAMIHFLPTAIDQEAATLIAAPAVDLSREVECDHPLVETTVLQSPNGIAIPLVNWSRTPRKNLRVTVQLDNVGEKASLASGKPVKVEVSGPSRIYTFDLDVADTLILR